MLMCDQLPAYYGKAKLAHKIFQKKVDCSFTLLFKLHLNYPIIT